MIDEDEAANEDHMINNREKPLLHDKPVVPLGGYIQREKVKVDSTNTDDSATSSLDTNESFKFSVVCSKGVDIHGQNTFQIVLNPPFITVNTQLGGESEEPLNIFPNIELDDCY